MKATTHNKLFRYCFGVLSTVLLAAGFAGCERESDLELSLAVNSNKLLLETPAGSTRVMIYSDGDWKVRFEEPINWGSLNVLAGTGNREVIFAHAENLEASRRVRLLISNAHGTDTVTLIQKGLKAELQLQKDDITITQNKAVIRIPLKTNLNEQLKQVKFRTDLTGDDASENDPQNPQNVPWMLSSEVTSTHLQISIEANNTGAPRQGRLTLAFIDGEELLTKTSVLITQGIEEPAIAFQNDEQEISRPTGSISVKLSTNAIYSAWQSAVTATYPENTQKPWISKLRIEGDQLLCEVEENTSGYDRSATITLSYPIAGAGRAEGTITASMTLIQTSTDLRMLIPSATGSVTIDEEISFEGIVISDAGNPNMEVNPNITLTSIDFSENDKTAYVQRKNGSYGLRLKFETAAANTLKRYSSVKISAQGLTLTKEENPTRYTLSGLTAENIINTVEGTVADLKVKNRKISELTDDDIYTFVSLDNVQIGINDGSYTNVTDGYQINVNNPGGTTGPRSDCTPLVLFDDKGDDIQMLINAKTPWRRTGSGVPAGSGSLKGIIVHSKLMRFGAGAGEIGRYSIRALEQEDIELHATEGFAQTLVEWNWNAKVLNTNEDTTLKPDVGTGSLYSTFKTTPSARWGYYGLAMSYNNKVNSLTTGNDAKGQLANTAVNFNCDELSWWNFTDNKGEAIVAEFSTTGVTGSNMMLIFDMLGGTGGDTNNKFPTYWQVEYSLDGQNFTKVREFGVRPLVWWSNTGIYCAPGLMNHAVKLPAELLKGKSKVYIALRAASTVCCRYNEASNLNPNADGAESNTLTSASKGTGAIRISTFSIKYY